MEQTYREKKCCDVILGKVYKSLNEVLKFIHEKEVCYDELMREIKIESIQNKTRDTV